jgi:uncharacterized integral membrane protein
MKRPKLIASLVVAVLFLIFLLQNTQVVTLRIYFWKISMSQIILIPLSVLLGFALGYVVARITGKKPGPTE